MLVTFKSEGAGDVMMFGDVADRLLEIIGKGPAAKGIVTVDQLPEAIARLRQAMDPAKAVPRGAAVDDENEDDSEQGRQKKDPVGVARRALPLLELLERARREERPVTWGV